MGITSDLYLLGVDGGGTGCRVALCDSDGHVLAKASGGPANYTTNPEQSLRNVLAAVNAVAAEASLTTSELGNFVGHIGLAGVMGPSDQQAIGRAMPFRSVSVSDDRVTSVAGALADRDGVLAAIGTGTIVAAREGEAFRFFGGWGHHLADQASGGWLGHEALRCTMLAHDGLLSQSDMTTALLATFDNDPVSIVKFAAKAAPGDFAAFAQTVVEAAAAGDANARALMQDGAAYLNTCFRAAGCDATSVICLAGGVGPHYEPYLEPGFRDCIRPSDGTALDGAVRLARLASQKTGDTP